MKCKKWLTVCCAVMIGFVNVNSVNAYTTGVVVNNKCHGLNQIKLSENIYPVSKINNIGTVKEWGYTAYNGIASALNGVAKLTWTGIHNPNDHHMYNAGYMYGSLDPDTNKSFVDAVGMELKPNTSYLISWNQNGTSNFSSTQIGISFCDSTYIPSSNVWSELITGKECKFIFKTPKNTKFMSYRFDPYWKWGTTQYGDYVEISNIQIKEVLN